MIDRVFEDELLVYTEDTHVDDDVKESLQKDVMLCFTSVVDHEGENVDCEEARIREVVEPQEEEGWTAMVPKLTIREIGSWWLIMISKNDGKEVGKVSKCKWIGLILGQTGGRLEVTLTKSIR